MLAFACCARYGRLVCAAIRCLQLKSFCAPFSPFSLPLCVVSVLKKTLKLVECPALYIAVAFSVTPFVHHSPLRLSLGVVSVLKKTCRAEDTLSDVECPPLYIAGVLHPLSIASVLPALYIAEQCRVSSPLHRCRRR